MSKRMKLEISALCGLTLLLLLVLITTQVMQPETFIFWFICETIGSTFLAAGVYNELRRTRW